MKSYSVSEIAVAINAKLFGNKDNVIGNLLLDSRSYFTSHDTLFFAICGKNHNGHNYIKELYKKKIKAFVVSELPKDLQHYLDTSFLLVDDTICALQQFAEYHRIQFDFPVAGITGSNGKTIVKEWLFQLLDCSFNIVRNPKSYNSQIGVPLSVIQMTKEHNLAFFEAGISMPDEMYRLEKIIKPQIGLITGIGDAHQENFKSLEQKAEEKLQLFKHSELIIYRLDYEVIDEVLRKNFDYNNIAKFRWARNRDCELNVKEINKSLQKTQIKYLYKNVLQEINIPFTDNASIENAIHCLAFILACNFESKIDFRSFERLQAVEMRLEFKKGINQCNIINDFYNSDLNSIRIALDFLNQQNLNRKKTLILSDILQTGKNEKSLYREVAQFLKLSGISRIIGIGKSLVKNGDFFNIQKKFYYTTDEFINAFSKADFNNETILLKGSRKFEFERISNLLQEKNHRTVLEINLDAITGNLNFFRSLLKPDTRIMVMVKAFSYGSGTYEIANLMQHQRVDYLGVAFADEGIELRKNGITLPIVVMNPESQSFSSMIEWKLEPEIYNFNTFAQFVNIVKQSSQKVYPIHIKIDTGMHRSGFMPDEIDLLIDKIKPEKSVFVASIFSHLAASDEAQHDEFTSMQIFEFAKISEKICMALDYPVLRHILNSAGIERFTDNQFDMVRLGIGLYGISGVNNDKLQNISTLKSYISQIKFLKVGETVGYNRKWQLSRDSKIAVVPVGYADGLNRRLSNGVGEMYVNGCFAKIVGNICMDMCMLDVTDIDCKEGDIVTVLGSEISIQSVADKLGTIPYEVLTGISERVKRVYYH